MAPTVKFEKIAADEMYEWLCGFKRVLMNSEEGAQKQFEEFCHWFIDQRRHGGSDDEAGPTETSSTSDQKWTSTSSSAKVVTELIVKNMRGQINQLRKMRKSQDIQAFKRAILESQRTRTSVYATAGYDTWRKCRDRICEKMSDVLKVRIEGKLDALVNDNLVFAARIFGCRGREQVAKLLKSIRTNEGAISLIKGFNKDPPAAEILEDSDDPECVKRVLAAYRRQDRHRHTAAENVFAHYLYLLEYHEACNKMVAEARMPNSSTHKQFKEHGVAIGLYENKVAGVNDYMLYRLFGIAVGRRLDSKKRVVRNPAGIDVDAKQCETARNRLYTINSAAKSIDMYVKTFGKGVLALLPYTSDQKLGEHRDLLKLTFKVVLEIIPETKSICERLEKHVMKPLEEGRQPPTLRLEEHQGLDQEKFALLKLFDVVKSGATSSKLDAKAPPAGPSNADDADESDASSTNSRKRAASAMSEDSEDEGQDFNPRAHRRRRHNLLQSLQNSGIRSADADGEPGDLTDDDEI